MFKSGKVIITVDKVESALKFYTEKLAFDLADLKIRDDGGQYISYAEVKKGKVKVGFRVPVIEELADFSILKRSAGRGVSLIVELKKSIDRYFLRCQKRGVEIISKLSDASDGRRSFEVKDIFGIRIKFWQMDERYKEPRPERFCGFKLSYDPDGKVANEEEQLNAMIDWVNSFGMLKRVSKKFARSWLKKLKGKL
ncbi:VOC family protein [bacterium]|nr:VOC family protein [bacterium]